MSLEKIFNEALNLFANEEFASAEIKFQYILNHEPNRLSVLNNLVVTKIKLSKFTEVESLCDHIFSIDSKNIDAQINLAICKSEQLLFEDSLKIINEVLSSKNNCVEAYIHKARMLCKIGKFSEASELYKNALHLEPYNNILRWNSSLHYLLTRSFQKGWKNYDCRFTKNSKLKKQYQDIPELKILGSFLKNKKIIIWCEQGYGDIIQFSRYLPLLKKKFGCVIYINLAKSLIPLFQYLDCDIKINTFDFYDFQLSIMDLPKLFNQTFQTIIDNTPYFKIPDNLVFSASGLLRKNRKINVGLAWSGRPDFPFDQLRSIPLKELSSILSLNSQCNFYALQKDIRNSDLELLQKTSVIHVAKNMDFLETASFIINLDLVISSDTSIVHLSGSLAKKTFAMIPFAPDWRWFLDLDYSPWYRSLRLFRANNSIGDWTSVVNDLKNHILRLIK